MSESPVYATYNTEWVAVNADNDEYPGNGSSWSDWPSPKFPESATIPVGSCVKGWIATEVPKAVRWKKFVWRPAGETTAEWLPR